MHYSYIQIKNTETDSASNLVYFYIFSYLHSAIVKVTANWVDYKVLAEV